MARRPQVKAVKKAAFHREMYPGVRFCERCFSSHNQPECPFPLAELKPNHVALEEN